MPTNEVILKRTQAGIEATRGTGVAATRKVYAQVNPHYGRGLVTFTDTTGSFDGRRRAGYARPDISFACTDILTYEDAAWWFLLGVKGGVSGVTDAGTPPAYTYTFLPTSSVDDLAAVTWEFGEPGNPYKSTQTMCNTFTVRMDADSTREPGWMIDASLMGRDWNSTTYTNSLVDRTTEAILAQGTKIYVDNAGGTIGTTQLLGHLISFSLTVNNAVHFKAFAEDVGSYAANKVGRGLRVLDAQFVIEFDNDTEFANYRATTPVQRLIRLEQLGTQIHGTSVTNKRIRADMLGYWSSWDDGDRNGNLTATFGFSAYYDVAAAKAFSFEVVNSLITLP